MTEGYNPIVRMFGRYRAALCAAEGLPRARVTVHTELATLVPPERRRAVWANLRDTGLKMPHLILSFRMFGVWACVVVGLLSVWCVVAEHWWPLVVGIVPLWWLAYWLSRPWAVHLGTGVRTVGELVVYGTRPVDHVASGYHWSHGDIELKVRLLIAEAFGVSLEQVRRETTFAELDDC